MKIILIGCVKSSELFLEKLIEIKADIVGVMTKKESRFNSDFVDLSVMCRKHGIDYFYVENINNQASKNYLYSKKPDLILCLGWSQLVDQEILAIPQMGCVGFHPAELPHNRGRHPLIWALVLGLERTASTLFFMDATADTGVENNSKFSEEFVKKRSIQLKKVEEYCGFQKVYNFNLATTKLEGYDSAEVIDKISTVFQEVKPEMLILPDYNDAHSDHKKVFEWCHACSKTFRFPYIKQIMTMESYRKQILEDRRIRFILIIMLILQTI